MTELVVTGAGCGTGDRGRHRAPPLPSAGFCVFLDVDGTLVDFAATPAEVRVDDALRELLGSAARRLQGALALISGRPLVELDRMFAPLRLPAAGVHGVERRDARGVIRRPQAAHGALAAARSKLQQLVAERPGLMLEDKRVALAVHFRLAPRYREVVELVLAHVVDPLVPAFHVLEGDHVMEIKPSFYDKATAVDWFMRQAPFAGRTPVFVGDDITDRDALEAVRHRGGIAIAVGDRIESTWRLPDPASVRSWLGEFIARSPMAAT